MGFMTNKAKLSPSMEAALIAILKALPLVGDASLAELPCHGRTAQALEDRKLINWKAVPAGTRWYLTEEGMDRASGLELAERGCYCPTPRIAHEATCPIAPKTSIIDAVVTVPVWCHYCPPTAIREADMEALLPHAVIVPMCGSVLCREVADDDGAVTYDVIGGTEIRAQRDAMRVVSAHSEALHMDTMRDTVRPYMASVARYMVRQCGYTADGATETVARYSDLAERGERLGSNIDYVAWEISEADYKAAQAEHDATDVIIRAKSTVHCDLCLADDHIMGNCPDQAGLAAWERELLTTAADEASLDAQMGTQGACGGCGEDGDIHDAGCLVNGAPARVHEAASVIGTKVNVILPTRTLSNCLVTGATGAEFGRNVLTVTDPDGNVWMPWESDTYPADTAPGTVHEACGLPITAHCAFCDVCPTDRERCGCPAEDTVGRGEDSTPAPWSEAPVADLENLVKAMLILGPDIDAVNRELRAKRETLCCPEHDAAERYAQADGIVPPVYRVEGQGARLFTLVGMSRGIATMRPVDGGMEWAHDAVNVYRVGADVPISAPRWTATRGKVKKGTGSRRRR